MSLLHRLIFGEGTEQRGTFSRESYPTYPTYPALPSKGTPPRPSVPALGAPLDAYRDALHRWWSLTAQGAAADPAETMSVYQAIVRLLDDVGEPRATGLRHQWAAEWYAECGICPTCGERGPYHDPESPQHG